MAKKPSLNFDEAYFLAKGFLPDGKGGFNPPKFRNPLTTSKQIANDYKMDRTKYPLLNPIITREKINNSPDFEAKPVTEWFVPYQVPSKKNCQQLYIRTAQGGKKVPAITPSQRYKDYISATKNYWTIFGKEFNNTVKKLNVCYPFHIEFTFVRSTLQRLDYVGPLESVQDIIVDFGWIPDDDWKHIKPILGDMEVDKNNPGVRIKLIIK